MSDEKIRRNIDRFIKTDNRIFASNYTVNDDLSVDADSVFIDNRDKGFIGRIPIRFGTVRTNFHLKDNKEVTSLRGCPTIVGGDFFCGENGLESLEYSPSQVGGRYNCNLNPLKSLEGCTQDIGSDFFCNGTGITSLKGAPDKLNGEFHATHNKLTNLEGLPSGISHRIDVSNNQLTSLKGMPKIAPRTLNISHNMNLYGVDYYPTEFDKRDNVKCIETPISLIYIDRIFGFDEIGYFKAETVHLMRICKMFVPDTNKIKSKNLRYFYSLMDSKLTEEDIKRIETRYEIV
jgi:hypothetical protein